MFLKRFMAALGGLSLIPFLLACDSGDEPDNNDQVVVDELVDATDELPLASSDKNDAPAGTPHHPPQGPDTVSNGVNPVAYCDLANCEALLGSFCPVVGQYSGECAWDYENCRYLDVLSCKSNHKWGY